MHILAHVVYIKDKTHTYFMQTLANKKTASLKVVRNVNLRITIKNQTANVMERHSITIRFYNIYLVYFKMNFAINENIKTASIRDRE